MEWACAMHEVELRNASDILVRKSEGKRQLWRPRRRWEGTIKMDIKEKNCMMQAIHLNSMGYYCEPSSEPQGSIKLQNFLPSCDS